MPYPGRTGRHAAQDLESVAQMRSRLVQILDVVQPEHRRSTDMRRYTAERGWRTVYQLPPYAPDLNSVEGIWSVLRRTTTANRAFTDPQDLINANRQGLRKLRYRPDVLDGCLAGTKLTLKPP